MTDGNAIITVDDLRISFTSQTGSADVVTDVSFSVGRERLGIVGESGSGKSLTARAVLRILPAAANMSANAMKYKDCDLLNASEKTMQRIRGKEISMIMQDPRFSLNPVHTVGSQIEESYRVHTGCSRAAARSKALEMLHAVSIKDPERVSRLYPHEVSGGMGQRIMIAMMLAPNPGLLIADEPTSALDVTVRLEVLSIIDNLLEQRDMGFILISHDLNLVRTFCDRVLIMYAGRVVEQMPAADLQQAKHPYTRGLLDASPRLGDPREYLPVLTRDPEWLNQPVSDE